MLIILNTFRSFQHVDTFKFTTHLTRTFDAANSNLSQKMRTQGNSSNLIFFHFTVLWKLFQKGESAYVCWAYSCATMIRAECTRLIKYLFQNGKIKEQKKNWCLEFINWEHTHKEIRNLVMMILLPKRLHFDGVHQAAFLRAAVSRVTKFKIN